MTETVRIPQEALHTAIAALFQGAGSNEEEAGLMAHYLVRSDLTGHASHGVVQAPRYLETLRDGGLNANGKLELRVDAGALALVAGGNGYGQPLAHHSMRLAIDKAKQHGLAAVGLVESYHTGRLADYAAMAAAEGMVGLVFGNNAGKSAPVAVHGGIGPRLATAPLAAAFPSKRDSPVELDMATSALANANFRLWEQTGQAVPPDVLIDKHGQPTQRVGDLFDGGAILPLGGAQGYKGTALAFMVETLAGVLTGGGFSGMLRPAVRGNCALFISINANVLRPLADFEQDLEEMIAHIKATPPRPGYEVVYPGERAARHEAENRAKGIPLALDVLADLRVEWQRYGVAVDL
jgi:LDH2 family malate/lactate/ureidoglycolate dehydrogenase